MLVTGFDGPMTTGPSVSAARAEGDGSASSRAAKFDVRDFGFAAACDPELLKVHLTLRRVDDARHGVVAHRDDIERGVERLRQNPRRLGERVAFVQQSRAGDVHRPVAVTEEHELRDARKAPPASDFPSARLTFVGEVSRFRSEVGRFGETQEFVVCRRRVVGDSPPRLAVQHVPLLEQHRVDIGADEEAAEFDVVPGVADDRRLGGREDPVRSLQQLGGSRSP